MPREQLGSRSNRVPSLAELASHAVEERLNNMCDEIPDEAEDRIADRRRRLRAELAVLANEKQDYINERMAELALEREMALEHMSVATGKSNQYCTKCKKIYIEDKSKCSVPGCVHSCSAESDEAEEEDSDYRPYECWFENNVMKEIANRKMDKKDKIYVCLDFFSYGSNICSDDFNEPSKTGYTKCWICSLPFCSRDFEKHYDRCRAKASTRCGFRPPTPKNGRGYVCVPGHCGKEVTQNDGEICCPDDCDTVCCNKCVSICQNDYEDSDEEYDYWGHRNNICGEGLCKFCVANGNCYGNCSDA